MAGQGSGSAGSGPSAAIAAIKEVSALRLQLDLHDEKVTRLMREAIHAGQAGSTEVEHCLHRLRTVVAIMIGVADTLEPDEPDDRGQHGPSPGSQLTLC